LAQEAGKAPEIEALEKQLADAPENQETAFLLAVQYSQHNFYREALALLLDLLKADINFRNGEAKKIYADILVVLGKGDTLAIEYQRKMYTLLY